MNISSIAIIGCGNLGSSIANGILQDHPEANLSLTRRKVDELQSFAARGINCTSDNAEAAKSDMVLLAVKPYNMEAILKEVGPSISEDTIVVSLASGVTIEDIRRHLNHGHIVRAMPNIAATVGESLTCISGQDETAIIEAQKVFSTIGDSVVIDESLMEASTVLGACGVAFVLRFIRAMIQGGIQIGFSAELASRIVAQTVKGSAQMMIQDDEHPEVGIDKVTTPKGCTIVGLNEMEHEGFSSSLIKGIVASFEKIESGMTE